MNYIQNTIKDSKITENQWQISNRLNFSKFTSCIGLVGYNKKSNGVLFGIHLVQATDDFFNDEDAKKVTELAVKYCEKGKVKLFGCLAAWQDNPAYDKLKELLTKKEFIVQEVTKPNDDGVYTVTYNTITSEIDIVKA